MKENISNSPSTEIEFSEWIKIGLDNGWCGPPVCYTHDGIPLSLEEETEMYEQDMDICVHIVRMYDSKEQQEEVTENHSPSQWRNHYTE